MPITIELTFIFQLINFAILGFLFYGFYVVVRSLQTYLKNNRAPKEKDKEKALEKMKIKDL